MCRLLGAGRLRRVARAASCRGSPTGRPGGALHAGGRLGPDRRPHRPPARAQPEPGLVLAADRRGAPAGRPAARAGAGGRAASTPPPASRSVVGDDYMVEHWLAAYAVLLLT